MLGPDLGSHSDPLRNVLLFSRFCRRGTRDTERLGSLSRVTQVEKAVVKPQQSGLRVRAPRRQRRRGPRRTPPA